MTFIIIRENYAEAIIIIMPFITTHFTSRHIRYGHKMTYLSANTTHLQCNFGNGPTTRFLTFTMTLSRFFAAGLVALLARVIGGRRLYHASKSIRARTLVRKMKATSQPRLPKRFKASLLLPYATQHELAHYFSKHAFHAGPPHFKIASSNICHARSISHRYRTTSLQGHTPATLFNFSIRLRLYTY